MAFTRKNVWELGGDWADPILWYARGVAAMQARALNDPTGWAFFAGIHGFDQNIWQQVGAPTDPMPSTGDFGTYWQQCQHGTWYFVPWHRGYLMALEATIRDAIKNMPGAPADWALPYWNYFKPNQNALPPAFASPDWPDGTGNNPLFVQARFGPNNDGNVFVDMDQVDEDALGDRDFIGPAQGGSAGFGGVRTGWSHGNEGNPHGGIESQPHDMVHVLVGGGTQDSPGLMSDPDTAGLDPIFYLHHANIDRLWEVWRGMPTAQGNPTEANWLNGPASTGQRAFVMPMPDGTSWTYTPNDVKDLSTLNYAYDDVSPPAAAPQALARLQRLGVAPAAAQALVRSTAMAAPPNVELLGANNQSIRVTGTEARTALTLESSVKNKVAASLQAVRAAAAAAATPPAPPDRVFLNLENVRGAHDAHAFDVYISAPGTQRELKAGSFALFGVRKASAPDGDHAGNGLTFVLDITHVIDALHLSGALDTNQLQVRLVPRHAVPDEAQISIGRISVYRQGK